MRERVIEKLELRIIELNNVIYELREDNRKLRISNEDNKKNVSVVIEQNNVINELREKLKKVREEMENDEDLRTCLRGKV